MLLPDELGVNIDTGDVIYDAPDLQLGVLQDVAEEGRLACVKTKGKSVVKGEDLKKHRSAAYGKLQSLKQLRKHF